MKRIGQDSIDYCSKFLDTDLTESEQDRLSEFIERCINKLRTKPNPIQLVQQICLIRMSDAMNTKQQPKKAAPRKKAE